MKTKIIQLKKWLQHKKDSVQRRVLFVFLSLLCHLMVVIFLHLAVLMTHQPSPETKTSIQFEVESVITKNKQNQFVGSRQSHQIRLNKKMKVLSKTNFRNSESKSTKNLNQNGNQIQENIFSSVFDDSYLQSRSEQVHENTYAEQNYTIKDNVNESWGHGSQVFQRVQDYRLMEILYSKMDEILIYPDELSYHKIEGVVNARIVLDQNGDCDFDHMSVQRGERHLQILVISKISEMCKSNFKKYIKDRQRTNVDMSFDFRLSEHNDRDLIQSEKKIVGNVLLFYRQSHQSRMQWELGPFKGLFPLPIVQLNDRWLMKHWAELMEDQHQGFKEHQINKIID